MADGSIPDVPARPDFVRFAEGFGQRFLVTVDTEEEFDWAAPLGRENDATSAVAALARFQRFCEGFGVVPIYLVDFPVATSPAAAAALGAAAAAGRCEIGVHLHPWVSPPHDEEVNGFNSFAGNLPPALERDKLRRLRDAIEANFGLAPLIFRAGRYGAGERTADFLAECGIAIDSSVRARFEYRREGGPDYRFHPLRPYWLGQDRSLIELPLTTVFWGPLRGLGERLYPRLERLPRVRGGLARLGLLERIPLTPEGVTTEEVLRGIDIALDDGLPLLVFSFHSPSLAPGHTPYVRDAAGLEAFYAWWREVFACLERRQVRPASVREIMASAELASPPAAG